MGIKYWILTTISVVTFHFHPASPFVFMFVGYLILKACDDEKPTSTKK